VSAGQFATSLLLGILSVLVPLMIFVALVATLVAVARWWIDRRKARP